MFLSQNPDVKSFDIYRPAWEFLKDAPKFQSIQMALKAGSQQKPETSTTSDAPDSPAKVVTSRASRPPGSKKSKRLLEEEKILANVNNVIQGNVARGSGTSSSAMLAAALETFTSSLIREWRMEAAYRNADPELKRKYDNAMLSERLAEMEAATAARNATTSNAPTSRVIGTPVVGAAVAVTPAAVTTTAPVTTTTAPDITTLQPTGWLGHCNFGGLGRASVYEEDSQPIIYEESYKESLF
jgi:hypothetical protein